MELNTILIKFTATIHANIWYLSVHSAKAGAYLSGTIRASRVTAKLSKLPSGLQSDGKPVGAQLRHGQHESEWRASGQLRSFVKWRMNGSEVPFAAVRH